ncbi:MAG: DUF6290 family protein [Lactobacillales bacterium]|jgi:predicted DNA-binding protein|nr:DUF6290 family protein [Lactobacillales bacterium]
MAKATSIRFDDELFHNVVQYTEAKAQSISSFVSEAVAVYLEDKIDYLIAEDAYKAWAADDFKTYTHDEMWAMLDE